LEQLFRGKTSAEYAGRLPKKANTAEKK